MADASSQAAAQEQLNLRVLQRSDPGVSRIVWVATHVCLYRFDEQARAWAKKGVEGTLFVVERSSSPVYRIVVLNRVSTENYTQDILAQGFETQVKESYFIYRIDGEVTGIWFYDVNELAELQKLVGNLVRLLNTPKHNSTPAGESDVLSKLFAAAAAISPAGLDSSTPSTATPHSTPLPVTATTPATTHSTHVTRGSHGTDAGGATILGLLSPNPAPTPQSVQGGGKTVTRTTEKKEPAIPSKAALKARLQQMVNDPQFIEMVWKEYTQSFQG